MPFRLLVAAIDLDDVAQALKRMEREADGQSDAEDGVRMRQPEMVRQRHQIRTAKVQVFENEKDKAGGNDTGHKAGFLSWNLVFPFFDKNAGRIIYRNGYQQNKDIFWNKPHIKEAAGAQQKEPAPLMRQQIE